MHSILNWEIVSDFESMDPIQGKNEINRVYGKVHKLVDVTRLTKY